jgi:hypothetical protein
MNESRFVIGPEGHVSFVRSTFELIAIETHAQLARFVVRRQMTSEDAAKISMAHAEALTKELQKKHDEEDAARERDSIQQPF